MLVFSRYFIDGTVASAYVSGDPTKSLEQYKFDSSARDITYYGTGCDNQWDQEKADEGYGGSDIPCSTRIVADADSEDQKNGTYYHYQAATSGSGSVQTADNINIPDTFCPLGWQLPYSGTGGDYYDKSRSWKYLFTRYGIGNNNAGSTAFKKYPLSYINAGEYAAYVGRLFGQKSNSFYGNGRYWSLTIKTWNAYGINTWLNALYESDAMYKGHGLPLRCNKK